MKWVTVLAISLIVVLTGCTPAEETVKTPNQHRDELVIIVHGLARNAASMVDMANGIKQQGYKTCVIDYPTIVEAIDNTLRVSAHQIHGCIRHFNHQLAQSKNGKVHFIGHSLGGLVIRSYLADHQDFALSDEMGEVVFLGTPNHGSDVADFFSNIKLLSLVGGTAAALTTGPNSLPNILPNPNYRFAVIAGVDSYPLLKHMFNNKNDGLVSVKSAQLPNMHDFIKVDIKHDQLRSAPYVFELILNYLSHQQFQPPKPSL
jgi:triacylglycerol esterase/lipase EstA (alpha/beta hydrolase family)